MSNFIKTIGKSFTAPSPSSASLTVSSAVTTKQGSIIVTVAYGNTAGVSVSSVTDSQSNTYVQDYAVPTGSTADKGLEFWRCQDPNALSTSDTITATMTGGTSDHGITMIADLYVRLGAPDVTNYFYTTPGATTGAVSATPSTADVIAVSAGAFNGGQATGMSVASPFTQAAVQTQTTSVSICLLTCYDSSPPNSSITATYTGTTAHTNVCAMVGYPLAPVGTGSLKVPKPALSGSGNFTNVNNGTGGLAVVKPALSGSGVVEVEGSGGPRVVKPALAGSGWVEVEGTGSLRVPKPALNGTPPAPPIPVVNPPWQTARAGLPGDVTATNKSAQIGQFLASHGITPIYEGTQIILPQGYPSLDWVNLLNYDLDQPFTMPAGKTTIGRVTLPISPVGIGADVLVGLYTDSSGNPGTLITQTRLPASWLRELGAPNGISAGGPLATAANNTYICGPPTTTLWTLAAVSLNGAGLATSCCSSGDFTIVAGGYDRVTNAAVPNVVTVQYLGGTSVGNPVNQPSLPQAAWGGMLTATTDTVVFAGGVNGANFLTNVWTASWDPNTGTIGAWTAQAALPNAWVVGSLASWNDFVYLVSGNENYNPNTAIQNVYYANAANGQIQSWLAAPPLPQPLNNAYVGVIGNWLVVAGGSNSAGTPLAECYYSAIRSDGSLAGWQTGPSLPEVNYQYNQGWNSAVVGNALVLVSGTNSGGVVDDQPVLMFSEDGPAPAWTHQLPIVWADDITGFYQGNNGSWVVFVLGGTSYTVSTLTPVPLISVPLPASGLTPGAKYHLVLDQEGGDLNDYVQAALVQASMPLLDLTRPAGGGSWSVNGNNDGMPVGVWDQTPGGKLWHTVEDGGARITSLITGSVTGQLLGLCEATEFGLAPLNANPYLTNGNLGGWQAGGGTAGTISVTNAQPAGSGYTWALECVSNLVGGGDFEEDGAPFPIVNSAPYVVSGLFYTPGSSIALGMDFLLNGAWVSSKTQTVSVTPNTWTVVTVEVTAPDSGVNQGAPQFSTLGEGSQYTMYAVGVVAGVPPAQLAAVSLIDYDGMVPSGVTQLA